MRFVSQKVLPEIEACHSVKLVDVFRRSGGLHFKSLIPAFAIISISSVTPATPQEGFWAVPVERAECIQKNAKRYAEQGSDPIVIVVQGCPEVDMTAALTSSAQNTAAVDVMGGDSVLILTRDELRCLEKTSLETDENGLVRIPKALACD